MKRWVCCGLVAVVVVLGLGLSEASARYYRGCVGVTAWPGAYVSYWAPPAYVPAPVYVAPPAIVVPRRVFYAPPPLYVPAPPFPIPAPPVFW